MLRQLFALTLALMIVVVNLELAAAQFFSPLSIGGFESDFGSGGGDSNGLTSFYTLCGCKLAVT